jgi:hypothetical protein
VVAAVDDPATLSSRSLQLFDELGLREPRLLPRPPHAEDAAVIAAMNVERFGSVVGRGWTAHQPGKGDRDA